MIAATGGLEAEISHLTSEERQLIFRDLKKEVTRIFCQLNPSVRARWVVSVRKLVEVLDYFEADPNDTLACSMEQAVELACAFIAQAHPESRRGISTTLH